MVARTSRDRVQGGEAKDRRSRQQRAQMRQQGDRQNREHQVVVLSEGPLPGQGISRNAQELAQITEVARLLGCRIVTLPSEGAAHGTAEEALAALSPYLPPVPGIWIGSIPTLARDPVLCTAPPEPRASD